MASEATFGVSVKRHVYVHSLYLFFDFAGYSALNFAFSYLLGVHTPENFNRPFSGTQYPRFLEPLAYHAFLLVPRPRLHAFSARGHARWMDP